MKKLLFLLIIFFTKINSQLSNHTCYGYNWTDPRVCSGTNSSCVSQDKCECAPVYDGSICNEFNCYGKPFNKTDTCSNRGNCTAPDTCKCPNNNYNSNCENCTNGYYGEKCDLFNCFKIPFNDSNVCSNRGTCTELDTCKCISNYYGPNCELFYCSGILYNSTKVCSGRGVCKSPNNCMCSPQQEKLDDNCGWTCRGISDTDPNVCDGNGVCMSQDQCLCKLGYWGISAWTCKPGLEPILDIISENLKHLTTTPNGSCTIDKTNTTITCDLYNIEETFISYVLTTIIIVYYILVILGIFLGVLLGIIVICCCAPHCLTCCIFCPYVYKGIKDLIQFIKKIKEKYGDTILFKIPILISGLVEFLLTCLFIFSQDFIGLVFNSENVIDKKLKILYLNNFIAQMIFLASLTALFWKLFIIILRSVSLVFYLKKK